MNNAPQIILVSHEDTTAAFPLEKDSDKLNPTICLKAPYEIESLKKEGYRFPEKIQEGTIVTLNPYNKKQYIDITDDTTILKDKMIVLEDIFRLLGVQNVYFELKLDSYTTEERSLNVKATAKGWKVGTNIQRKKSKDYKETFYRAFEAKPLTIEQLKVNYRTVKEKIKGTPLEYDTDIMSLIERRNPDFVLNDIINTCSCELSKEMNDKLDCLATLQHFDPNIFNLSVKARQEINTKAVIQIRCQCIWDWEKASDIVKETYKNIYKTYMMEKLS